MEGYALFFIVGGSNMKNILLDTNMFIYLEDYKVTNEKIITLTKRLFDSDKYKIVIHPKTKNEILKIKDLNKRKIFLSKISVYKEVESAPSITEDFNNIVGCKNSNDKIDNELLFSIYRNCAYYLITNDKGLIRKAKTIHLEDRVLSIDKALLLFKEDDIKIIKKPIFIDLKYLYELDINDVFFDSLKQDYSDFANWFATKQLLKCQAYVSEEKNKLTSFLMLKIEDETEKYDEFLEPFLPARRLKISTMKVSIEGKKIGETFIKIIIEKAMQEKVDEIYVTTFEKQSLLIEMLEEYGFKKVTKKRTKIPDGKIELEDVLVKRIKDKTNYFPFFTINGKKKFIVPIKEKYHNLLFQESEKSIQLSMDDYNGLNVASNSIKKAYICCSNIKKIEKGSIILFYSSGIKKSITCLGIVDGVFTNFNNYEEMYKMVKKRTVYDESELRENFKRNSLVILFKLYYSFDKYVSYSFLLKNRIVTGPIRRIMEIRDNDLFLKILRECEMEQKNYIIY